MTVAVPFAFIIWHSKLKLVLNFFVYAYSTRCIEE